MYAVSVETRFSATHSLRLHDGSQEPVHEHDWYVRAFFANPDLDSCAMVVDFTRAKAALARATEELCGADLNAIAPLEGRNPTAEVIARFVYDRLCASGLTMIRRVDVTEAPGCIASFESLSADARMDRAD